MERFIGRENELEYLNGLYSEPGLRTCAVYGRRRIGKSSLIRKFCEGKRTIHIQFVKSSESVNLDIIRAAVEDVTGKDPGRFENVFRALRSLAEFCKEEKTVLVLDEFPFLTSCAKYIPSAVQRFIDVDLKGTKTLLIACGSSIRTMKDETEDPKRPLYGRFPVRMQIGPLSPAECREFHPGMSDIDFLKVYMAVGGVPYYHEMMDRDTFRECVIKNFIASPAPLFDEAGAMIDRELSPPSVHSAIISFLAKGANRVNELADKARISHQLCGRYLRDMEAVGIVERINPMAGAPKHPLFRVKDNLIYFYYGAIEKRMSILSNSDVNAAYEKIEHDIDSCLGHIFEDVCSEHIKRTTICKEIGKWWGPAGNDIKEIDIIAVIDDDGNEVSLFCECKLRRRPPGLGTLNSLKDTAEYIKTLNNRRFVIFSAFGFDEDLEDYVTQYGKTAGIRLIGIGEILR